MAFRKKAKQQEVAGAKEWDQTLIAEDSAAPQAPAALADAQEALDLPPEEPVAQPASMPNVPEDLQPLVTQEGERVLLREYHLSRPVKRDLENRVAPRREFDASEARWLPHKQEPLADVARQVDALEWTSRYKPRATVWLKRQKEAELKASEGLERIPPNIIEKRIVYETEGGFVVEVVYRETGELKRKYFTVDAKGGRRKALQSVKSGNYARTTILTAERIELLRPRGARKPGTPPGKVRTWPVTNEVDVKEVEGIGDTYTRRLYELGIQTTDQLRLASAEVLAGHLGVSPKVIEKWQQMSELLLVPGIGKQTAEVLVRAGITGIEDLQGFTPKELAERVNAFAAAAKVRGITPPAARSWSQKAKRMRKSLQAFPSTPETPGS